MEGAEPGLSSRSVVIGAAGLVGRHVRAALEEGALATSWRTQAPDALPLDITDPVAVREFLREHRPAAIVLAAAEASVEACELEPDRTRRVNVEAARVVAEEASRTNALVVAFSSEYVFDGTGGPYSEEAPVNPINEYGRQKVAMEGIVRSVPRHLICRTSGVFGREASRKNFVLQLVDRLRAGEPFAVPSDQLITPTYAPDLARAVVALMTRGVTGTVNVCGPQILARTDFATMAASAFGLEASLLRPTPTVGLGLRAPRPLAAGLIDGRLRELVGPLRPPAEGLAELARAV